MNAVTFDTLKFTRKLKEAGFTAKQAEGVAVAFCDAVDDELVTKSYLHAELAKLELRLTTRIGGMIVAAVAILLAFDKLL